MRLPRALLLAPLAVLPLHGCGGPYPGAVAPEPEPEAPGPPPAPDAGPRVVFLVDHPLTPNPSERAIRERLVAAGWEPEMMDDEAFVPSDTVGVDLFVVSKTVEDSLLKDGLKACPCGIFFWEENLQMLRGLATVANDGSDGAFWHKPGRRVYVRPDAPAALREGLGGAIEFYDREAEISYGKRQDVPPGAIVVADHSGPDGHRAVYAIERGAPLADGTPAAGRRFFFGLHRDTFRYLSPDASRLFDAGLRWTVEPEVEG